MPGSPVLENQSTDPLYATGDYRGSDKDPLITNTISGNIVYAPRCNDTDCTLLTETTYADSKVKNTTLLK